MSERYNVVVGIGGASGAAIGVPTVERLAENPAEPSTLLDLPAFRRSTAHWTGAGGEGKGSSEGS